MADAKLEVKIGGLEFVGEGSEKWLSDQLKTLIDAAPKLATAAPLVSTQSTSPATKPAAPNAALPALGTYISSKGGSSNQNKRFLATADWLRQKAQPLSTAAVTKALKDYHQTRLGNPAQCLNSNVSSGFAEKTENGFFITPEGLKSLGHTE